MYRAYLPTLQIMVGSNLLSSIFFHVLLHLSNLRTPRPLFVAAIHPPVAGTSLEEPLPSEEHRFCGRGGGARR